MSENKSESNKRLGFIVGGVVEAAIIIFCLVISIMVLVTNTGNTAVNLTQNGEFIGGLQNNSVLFFCSIVLPIFLVVAVDVVFLIYIATSKSKEAAAATAALTEADQARIKEEARLEAIAELEAEEKAKKESENK